MHLPERSRNVLRPLGASEVASCIINVLRTSEATPTLITRRQMLAGFGLVVLGAACTSKRGPASSLVPPGSIQALLGGASQVSVLGTGAEAPSMNPGPNRVAVVLVTLENQGIQGGTAQFWLAKDPNSRAMGPFSGSWYPFTGYEKTGDRSPVSRLPGAYAAQLNIPTAGIWDVGVVAEAGSKRYAGTGLLHVTDGAVPVALGSKATSVATPVATSDSTIARICTRTPVDHMHYISLDEALQNGKPTVVCFGTPLLCTSRLCGPVLDEQILAFQQVGKDRANFIHVEEFLPGHDLQAPAPTLESRSPAFKAWDLDTEPWMGILDRQGVIRFRALGPVTAPEIVQALQPLL